MGKNKPNKPHGGKPSSEHEGNAAQRGGPSAAEASRKRNKNNNHTNTSTFKSTTRSRTKSSNYIINRNNNNSDASPSTASKSKANDKSRGSSAIMNKSAVGQSASKRVQIASMPMSGAPK